MALQPVQVFTVSTIFTSIPLLVLAASVAKPGCPEKCGNIKVLYPFGIGKDCFLTEPFELTCDTATGSLSSAFFSGVDVRKIDVDNLRVNIEVPHSGCLNNKPAGSAIRSEQINSTKYFSYSSSKNKLFAIRCDIFAWITDLATSKYLSGCASICPDERTLHVSSFSSSPCSGIGCCQTDITQDISSFKVKTLKFNHTKPFESGHSKRCDLAFIAEKGFSKFEEFHVSDINQLKEHRVPVVIDWVVDNVSCSEASRRENYACGAKSSCVHSHQGLGYNCQCHEGYTGNPYLQNGCQAAGVYQVINAKRSQPKTRDISLGIGTSTGVIILLAAGLWLNRSLEKRKKNKLKHKFFKKNGGLSIAATNPFK